MSKPTVTERVLAHLPSHLAGMSPDTPVLLALSGGADSRALLHLLKEAATRDGFPLLLAHVNHGIRGKEALRDRDFCARLADAYRLPIFFLDADVPTLAARNRRGIEEEGRCVRYEFFDRLMREKKIPLLATAHHADDALETLLLRLLRGTALRGLCGIPPVRAFGEGFLTRPLLTVTREEILAYCQTEGLEFVNDSTNDTDCCERNLLRREILPPLRSLAPTLSTATVRMQEMLREDNELLDALADELWTSAARPSGFCRETLRNAPSALVRRVLLRLCEERGIPTPSAELLRSAVRLLHEGHTGESLAFPADQRLVLECDEMRLLPAPPRRRRESPNAASEVTAPLQIPFAEGEIDLFGDGSVLISVQRVCPKQKVHKISTPCYTNFTLSPAIIKKGELFWRTRAEGDRIRMGGMHRSLRRLYSEKKIPPRLRDRMPLLCDAEGILVAPAVGARDGASFPAEETADALTVRLRFSAEFFPATKQENTPENIHASES